MTPEAEDAIAVATEFFGYGPYLDRLHLRAGSTAPSPRTTARNSTAPRQRSSAPQPRADVCVVSGGDPGIFAMAAAVCEAIDKGPQEWREVDLIDHARRHRNARGRSPDRGTARPRFLRHVAVR